MAAAPHPNGADAPAAETMPGEAPRLLTDLLDKAVAHHPDWPAVDFLGRRWRYCEIDALVTRAARGLQKLGVKPGDRVGLCLPNTPYFVIGYFAILRIGGVVVNFNPLYTERELKHQILDSGARVMLVADLTLCLPKFVDLADETNLAHVIVCPIADVLPPVTGLLYKLFKRRDIARDRHRSFVEWRTLIADRAAPDPVARSPHDLAVLQYTGGTTGVPKGAMLTHANLAANSAQMIAHVGHLPDKQERTLGVLPLFHVFALTTVLNYSIDTAAEMVLLPRFEMKQFLATIRRTRPTQFFGVPTLYNAMNALPADKAPNLSTIRVCISGGAPLPPEVRTAFESKFGVKLVEGYGLSEASPIIACNPLDHGVVKDASCGPAFPGTVLEIRDLDDPGRLMPQGEKGEVCARGPQVMLGYWNRPDETQASFIEGALRTGDVGYLDPDGYLFLVDRIKDLILCGGYNVYPRVIEDALYEHPAIAEAIVIGVPHPYRGQSPKAFVALRPGMSVSEEELCGFLKERLNKIELPSAIEFRDTLPKTMVGKLSKKALIEQEAARG